MTKRSGSSRTLRTRIAAEIHRAVEGTDEQHPAAAEQAELAAGADAARCPQFAAACRVKLRRADREEAGDAGRPRDPVAEPLCPHRRDVEAEDEKRDQEKRREMTPRDTRHD